MKALIIIIMCATFCRGYNKTEIHIRPFSLNRRGVIGPGRTCPKNAVGIGFKMKMQHYRSMEDNSALNGVRLICTDDTQIKSSEGRKGDWTDELRCKKDDYMVGVKIKTEVIYSNERETSVYRKVRAYYPGNFVYCYLLKCSGILG